MRLYKDYTFLLDAVNVGEPICYIGVLDKSNCLAFLREVYTCILENYNPLSVALILPKDIFVLLEKAIHIRTDRYVPTTPSTNVMVFNEKDVRMANSSLGFGAVICSPDLEMPKIELLTDFYADQK